MKFVLRPRDEDVEFHHKYHKILNLPPVPKGMTVLGCHDCPNLYHGCAKKVRHGRVSKEKWCNMLICGKKAEHEVEAFTAAIAKARKNVKKYKKYTTLQ